MGEDNPVENFMEKQIDETSKNDELIDWKKREREKKKMLKKFDFKKKPQFYHTYYVKKKAWYGVSITSSTQKYTHMVHNNIFSSLIFDI